MSVPRHLLVNTVTIVRPAEEISDYGDTTYDYGDDASRTEVDAWMQQDNRDEPRADGRDPQQQIWLMVTNHDDIRGVDRVEWDDHPGGAVTFNVEGPPEPAYTPAGYHHTETTLRIFNG